MHLQIYRFVITSEARDLLFARTSAKQVFRGRKLGSRNDKTARRIGICGLRVTIIRDTQKGVRQLPSRQPDSCGSAALELIMDYH
jgi:hypothetical protein